MESNRVKATPEKYNGEINPRNWRDLKEDFELYFQGQLYPAVGGAIHLNHEPTETDRKKKYREESFGSINYLLRCLNVADRKALLRNQEFLTAKAQSNGIVAYKKFVEYLEGQHVKGIDKIQMGHKLKLFNMRQEATENVRQFYSRFVEQVSKCNDWDVKIVDAELKGAFKTALHPVSNSLFLPTWRQHETKSLEDIVRVAEEWEVGDPQSSAPQSGNSRTNKEDEQSQTPGHAFQAADSKTQHYNKYSPPMNKGNNNNNRGKRFKGRGKGNERKFNNNNNNNRNNDNNRQERNVEIKCHHCFRAGVSGFGHHEESSCPLKARSLEWQKKFKQGNQGYQGNKRQRGGQDNEGERKHGAYMMDIPRGAYNDEDDFEEESDHEAEPIQDFGFMAFVGINNLGVSQHQVEQYQKEVESCRIRRTDFIYDSGCTNHVFNNKESLKEIRPISRTVNGVNGPLQVTHAGVHPIFGFGFLVEDCPVNLISHDRICKDFLVYYHNDERIFEFQRKLQSRAAITEFATKRVDGLQIVNLDEQAYQGLMFSKETDPKVDTQSPIFQLHFKLDHPNMRVIYDYLRANDLFRDYGVKPEDFINADFCKNCEGCRIGKTTSRSNLPKVEWKPKVGERQHADIVFLRTKKQLVLYFVSVDEVTGLIQVHQMANKQAKTIREAVLWIKSVYAKFGHNVGYLHTDAESAITKLKDELWEDGVELVQVGAGTHERVVERTVRTIRDKFRSTLYSLPYRLPSALFPWLFVHVVQSINLTPNKLTGIKTPYEIVTRQQPRSEYLRFPFGKVGSAHEPNHPKSTDERGFIGIYVGRNHGSGTVNVWRINDGRVVTRGSFSSLELSEETRKAIERFDGARNCDTCTAGNCDTCRSSTVLDGHGPYPSAEGSSRAAWGTPRDATVGESSNEQSGQHLPSRGSDRNSNGITAEGVVITAREFDVSTGNGAVTELTVAGRAAMADDQRQSSEVTHRGRRSEDSEVSRLSRQSPSINGARTGNTQDGLPGRQNPMIGSAESEDSTTRAQGTTGGILTENNKRRRVERDYKYLHQYGMLLTEEETRTAVYAELTQMHEKGVFEYLTEEQVRQVEEIILPTRMLLTEKRDANGKKIKGKARLVAGGNHEEIDQDISSPTASFSTIMLMFVLALINRWEVDKIDVAGAYLEARLNNKAYVFLDEQLTKDMVRLFPMLKKHILSSGRLVARLKKAMYGLREAAKAWYEHLTQVLMDDGFERNIHDQALLTKKKDGKIIHMVAIHVDDIASIGTKESKNHLIAYLKKRFQKITYVEDITEDDYLNMRVTRNREENSITLTQPGYIQAIIDAFEVKDEYRDVPYRGDLFQDPEADQRVNVKKYQSLVMKLMYATKLRPDIKLPVVYLSTKMQDPRRSHMEKLRRVAAYLNATKDFGLKLKPTKMELYSSADASFAVHETDGRSHTGFTIHTEPGVAPIIVQSKKQTYVTLSSTEAELVAAGEAVKEVMQVRDLLASLGWEQKMTTQIEQDNNSAISIANSGYRRRKGATSIRTRYFFLKEHIDGGIVKFIKIPSADMIADGLTKPLPKHRFIEWRDRMLGRL